MKEAIDKNKLTLIHGKDLNNSNLLEWTDGSFEFLEPIKENPDDNDSHALVIKKYLDRYFKSTNLSAYIEGDSICYQAGALLAFLEITVFINSSAHNQSGEKSGILFLPIGITDLQRESTIALLNMLFDYNLIILYFYKNKIYRTNLIKKDEDKIEEFRKVVELIFKKEKQKIRKLKLKDIQLVK